MKTILVKPTENTIIEVLEDSQYVLDLDGGETNTYKVELLFVKSGVTAEILGIYCVKNARINLETIANHRVPHTTCDTKVKGVLMDKGHSNYVGKIIIAPEAQQTSSFLDDSVLVVGKKTHNSSEPILEIDADDVKASHGATTGALDENQVYYLTSRGLSIDEAQDIIINGFFESLLSEISDETIRDTVRQNLKKVK